MSAEVFPMAPLRRHKVTIIKFRRRKHSMKRQGHRQWFTEVKITGIPRKRPIPFRRILAMAHKKAAGSTRNGRDSRVQTLRCETLRWPAASAGSIIVRQRGTRFPRGHRRWPGSRPHAVRSERRLCEVRRPRVRTTVSSLASFPSKRR